MSRPKKWCQTKLTGKKAGPGVKFRGPKDGGKSNIGTDQVPFDLILIAHKSTNLPTTRQILMQGVWVDGARVLQNQAVVIDINSPFILAPPLAAKAFYSSVSGSWPLPAPHSNFYAYPCLNPPVVQFEFGSHRFPFMQGGRGADWTGTPGGQFSLGRLKEGSGYCVGAVVQTRMDVREEQHRGDHLMESKRSTRKNGSMSQGGLAGNGMRDVWVIGEGFFRGIGGAFDVSIAESSPMSYVLTHTSSTSIEWAFGHTELRVIIEYRREGE